MTLVTRYDSVIRCCANHSRTALVIQLDSLMHSIGVVDRDVGRLDIQPHSDGGSLHANIQKCNHITSWGEANWVLFQAGTRNLDVALDGDTATLTPAGAKSEDTWPKWWRAGCLVGRTADQ